MMKHRVRKDSLQKATGETSKAARFAPLRRPQAGSLPLLALPAAPHFLQGVRGRENEKEHTNCKEWMAWPHRRNISN